VPEVFYQQLRRQRRRAALSVTAFVLTLCLLPLALIAFRRYPLLGTALLAGCAAMVLVCYRVRRVPPDAPELYSAPILVDDPTARLAACGAEQVGADAQVLFATDGRLHARVLALECDDFDAQRMKAIRHRANQKLNQQYRLSQQISISDSYTQFRLNLVLAARDNGGAAQLGKYTAGAFAAAVGTDRAGGRCARAECAAVPGAAPMGHAG